MTPEYPWRLIRTPNPKKKWTFSTVDPTVPPMTIHGRQEYNTCNPWGFGGSIGETLEVSLKHNPNFRFFVSKGTAYFRHLPPVKVLFVRGLGRSWLDLQDTKKCPTGLPEAVFKFAKGIR